MRELVDIYVGLLHDHRLTLEDIPEPWLSKVLEKIGKEDA